MLFLNDVAKHMTVHILIQNVYDRKHHYRFDPSVRSFVRTIVESQGML